MEAENIPIEPSTAGEKVLFTERAIIGSTLLGGPVAGTYLLKHNFGALGKLEEAKRTLLIGILATVVFVPVVMLIPEGSLPKSITRLFEFLWVIPIHLVVKRFQKSDIQHHLEAGGKKGSAWKAAGAGFAGLAILLAYAALLAFTVIPSDEPELPQFEPGVVEAEFTRCRVYFDSTALLQSDAKVVGAILEKVGYFNPQHPENEALFYKENGTYLIAIGVAESGLSDRSVDEVLQNALIDLHQAYSNRQYRFRLLAIGKTGISGERYLPAK